MQKYLVIYMSSYKQCGVRAVEDDHPVRKKIVHKIGTIGTLDWVAKGVKKNSKLFFYA